MENAIKQIEHSGRKRVYNFIVDFIQNNGYLPTVREICIGTGLRFGRKRGIRTMNIHNFNLSSVFQDKAKEYVTRPVKAMKYQPGLGIENGWMVYFTNVTTKERGMMMHEGIKFFPTEADAWKFININEKQYVKENGELVNVDVTYDPPKPV